MTKIKLHLRSLSATLLILLFAGHPVLADDTEVLIGSGGQAWAKPNVLFIMDTSGSMGNNIAGDTATATDPSRLSIVQSVFEDLMNNNSGFNVGLMRFDSSGNGGFFVRPMQELNSTSRAGIISTSNDFTAGGNTPLSETLYEAARFYGGLSVDFGDSSNPDTNHADVFTGNNYDTPISSECQANYVVLLTDGEPTSDTGADDDISTDFLGGTSCTDNCLDEVAGYLHTQDQSTGGNSIAGTQTVDTFTIGFTTDQALLLATGLAGGGTPTFDANGDADGGNNHYTTANNETQLSNAFATILDTITDTNDSFSPPALAANSFNGISHHNRLYFALFEPAGAPKWTGNVKPYALNDNFQLVDAEDPPRPAIDARGFFLEASRSFWSSSDDGVNIITGGANDKLPSEATRNIYTYTGDYDTVGSLELNNASNALTTADTSDLTTDMLGLSNANATLLAAEFEDVVSAARSAKLGAPLHSEPALVTYGGTETDPDLTLFVATNDGFLHAIDASDGDGEETFSFIPQELLPNLADLTNTTGNIVYGLDGDITTWVKESRLDTDNTIEASEGDHVYVYVGMRRGGNNYYALDVTTRSAPVLKWVIKGGTGGTTGFEELGQSWSKPTLTSIKYGADTKKVLIFAGGYDNAQDANPLNNVAGNNDSIGRAIFIVDADDGTLLWSAGPTISTTANLKLAELTHSIPSDVRLLDSNLDGYTDRLYVGDMRGQVFRFDFQATTTGVSGTGVRLASLGGSSEADNRRFFYPPDVVVTQNQSTYISLNIGSGYRAHPLNPLLANGNVGDLVDDRFYSLRDPYVIENVPTTFTTITNASSSLLDVTNLPVLNPTNTTNLNNLNGWYITLAGDGEKVLAQSVTLNGEIFFTTYTPPESVAASSCAPPPGTGRLYLVSLFDASPVIDQNADSDTDDLGDRIKELDRPGIPPAPNVMFHKGSDDNVTIVRCVGTECEESETGVQIQKTYWLDN